MDGFFLSFGSYKVFCLQTPPRSFFPLPILFTQEQLLSTGFLGRFFRRSTPTSGINPWSHTAGEQEPGRAPRGFCARTQRGLCLKHIPRDPRAGKPLASHPTEINFSLLCPFPRQFGEGETKISCSSSFRAGLGKRLPRSSAPAAAAAGDAAMGNLSSCLFSAAGGMSFPHRCRAAGPAG